MPHTQGHSTINFDRFAVAMFKLCDVWTDYVNGQLYYDFLTSLRSGKCT